MRFIAKLPAFVALTAFVAVFVLGCFFGSMSEGMTFDQMGFGATHAEQSDAQEDHMNIALALPAQSMLPFLFLAVILAFSLFISSRNRFVEPAYVRWKQRSRKEIFSEWNRFVFLFQAGILNPKIL